MWVSSSERAWRRREEAASLASNACLAEQQFAAWAAALSVIVADGDGSSHLARLGVAHAARSWRLPVGGVAEGLSVLEGVVLSGVAGRLLSDAALMRWLSRTHLDALADLHRAAGEKTIATGSGDLDPSPSSTVQSG